MLVEIEVYQSGGSPLLHYDLSDEEAVLTIAKSFRSNERFAAGHRPVTKAVNAVSGDQIFPKFIKGKGKTVWRQLRELDDEYNVCRPIVPGTTLTIRNPMHGKKAAPDLG